MNYWKVILATVVIFGAGVLTGGLLVNFVDHSHPRNFHRPPPALTSTNAIAAVVSTNVSRQQRVPEILSKPFVEQLNEELQLTPEQRATVENIITESQGQMRKAVQGVRQGAREKIRELLDPAQQKQFDELLKRPPRRLQNGTNAPAILSAPTNAPGV